MGFNMYDVAVIGLGPAGVFLAKHLSRSHRVIAIDKKLQNCDGGFHKPCGGLLAPDAQKSLSRFNMSLPKDILVSPQIFSVRTIDVKTGLIRNYQRHYINLDRHRFDQWLIGQIPDYVEVRSGVACTDVMRSNDGFEVTYNENNMSKTIRAKYLVGADGAASIIRRSLFKEFKIHSHLSIQQWFSDSHNTPFYSCVFDSDLTDSYAWGLTKDNYFVFGGAFAKETGKHDFEVLKGKLKAYGFQLDTPLKTEACLVLRPVGPRNYCYGHDGVFLLVKRLGLSAPVRWRALAMRLTVDIFSLNA